MPDSITVNSSHGSLFVDPSTGVVLHVDQPAVIADDDFDLRRIYCVDLEEYRRAYPQEAELPSSIDILDVGYWFIAEDGAPLYEPPDVDWRIEFRELAMKTETIVLR